MRASLRRRAIFLTAGSVLAVGLWSVGPAGAAPPPEQKGGASTQEFVHDCVASGHPNLELGDGYGSSETNAVKRAQCLLNWALTYTPKLVVDGKFGPMTRDRTIQFQRCMVYVHGENIYIDGEIGPQTWPLLEYWAASPYYAC